MLKKAPTSPHFTFRINAYPYHMINKYGGSSSEILRMPIDNLEIGERLLLALGRIEQKLERLQPLQDLDLVHQVVAPEENAGPANQETVAVQKSPTIIEEQVAPAVGVKQVFGTDVNGDPVRATSLVEALHQIQQTKKRSNIRKFKRKCKSQRFSKTINPKLHRAATDTL